MEKTESPNHSENFELSILICLKFANEKKFKQINIDERCVYVCALSLAI